MIHLIHSPLQEQYAVVFFSVEMYVIPSLLGAAFTGYAFGNSCSRRELPLASNEGGG